MQTISADANLRSHERTHPRAQDGQPRLAVRLHRRLDGVDRREDHPERGGSERRKDRLRKGRQVPHVLVALEQGEDADVRSGVAEARDGALDERGGETLVVARPAAVSVERLRRLCHGRTVAILVVHDRVEGIRRWSQRRRSRGPPGSQLDVTLQCRSKVELRKVVSHQFQATQI